MGLFWDTNGALDTDERKRLHKKLHKLVIDGTQSSKQQTVERESLKIHRYFERFPKLFNCFINCLPSVENENNFFFLYADDTNMISTHNRKFDLTEYASNGINYLKNRIVDSSLLLRVEGRKLYYVKATKFFGLPLTRHEHGRF